MDSNVVSTDVVEILTSAHGKQRRAERKIALQELNATIRNGSKERVHGPKGEPRWKYRFGGVVFITDDSSTREITSWPQPGWGIDLEKKNITLQMQHDHEQALTRNYEHRETWTSHTVVVVDQSGSMRKTDCAEEVTRSDLVWLTLALKVVAEPLNKGERKSTDVLTLIVMQDSSDVAIKCHPFDWILYNRFVDFLRMSEPLGHGNYLPALDKAKFGLNINQFGNCALMLVFLSDGRPSDKIKKGDPSSLTTLAGYVRKRIQKIAERLGSRLTVGAIAIGEEGSKDEFVILRALLDGAKEYGCKTVFQPASLSARALASTFTKLSSLLSDTKLEMTDLHSGRQRRCRKYRIEPLSNVGGTKLSDEFVAVKFHETEVIQDGRTKNWRSILNTRWVPGAGWRTTSRSKLFHSEQAVGVAFKSKWFGQGAERLVKEFREFDSYGNFVGPILVAKDTKYLRDSSETDGSDEKDFHKVFIKTQQKAQKLARLFNRRLLKLPFLDADSAPSIEFLDCSVYMIEHPEHGRHGYLVERMLDIKKFNFEKWNDNAGKVWGLPEKAGEPLATFEEEDSLDTEDSVSVSSSLFSDVDNKADESTQGNWFNIKDIPQAFSCFTHWVTERDILVCDLQGVLNTDRWPSVYELTDPVIHHRSSTATEKKYGKTDLGLAGMEKFFASHQCTPLCDHIKKRILMDDAVQLGHQHINSS